MNAMTGAGDRELLAGIAAGEEAALVALYRLRQGAVYRFALQMSGSAALAEDVTQEVFLKLIRGEARYDAARGSVLAFLYGVARNLVLRAATRERGITEDVAGPQDVAADVLRSQEIEAVRRAVLALPLHYRETVVLCDLHEMEYADAAAALGCSVGTVRSRLHRARAMLAERLAPKPVRCGA